MTHKSFLIASMLGLGLGLCAACSSHDGDKLEARDPSTGLDGGGRDLDAGAGRGSPGSPGSPAAPGVTDGGDPDDDSCRPNPDFDEADPGSCPTICPEVCNGLDDDCDRSIDEGAASSCQISQAAAACIAGECRVAACQSNYRDCDGDHDNGCEIPPDDPEHCGGCGVACGFENAVSGCIAGTCASLGCLETFENCDDDDATGCETPITILQHCGGCGLLCDRDAAISACIDGACGIGRCEAGRADCNGDPSDGCERAVDSLRDCGGCGVACERVSCGGGVCTNADCAWPSADCNADGESGDGCEIDVSSDADHCGACGASCDLPAGLDPHGTPGGCVEARCQLSCDDGYDDCDDDPQTGCETSLDSRLHCGGCGQICAIAHAVSTCGSGECRVERCLAGWDDCNADALDCETSLRSVTDCGACGQLCELPQGVTDCASGSCELVGCEPGYEDCNGDPLDGCERHVAELGPCIPEEGCVLREREGHAYYFCPLAHSFAEARDLCRLQAGGDLVRIDDAEEEAFLVAELTEASWSGATDLLREGVHAWSDNGAPFWNGAAVGGRYSNWNPGEPNDFNAVEDCVELYQDGGWNDLSCDDIRPFVCEVPDDACLDDDDKLDPGQCGCGVADTDADSDVFAACVDSCDGDVNKVAPGQCGCGVADTDTDSDGSADCVDGCDLDGTKLAPGACGCGVADSDADADGTPDCNDLCPIRASTAGSCLPFAPGNFDPDTLDWLAAGAETLDCGTTTINTSGGVSFGNFCGGNPAFEIVAQTGGPELVVIPVASLTIASGSTLQLSGDRAVVFVVAGDATVAGTISADASGTTPGAGGNQSCGGSSGGNGSGSNSSGAGGGGGGAFGSRGGNGGSGGGGSIGSGGTTRGEPTLTPLLGGCGGGNGGGCSGSLGAGGGAIQIATGGALRVSGTVRANGSGGSNGCGSEGGGRGGGSGGGIRLEGASVNLTGATLQANGGRGGNGGTGGNGGNGSTSAGANGSNGGNDGANGGGGGGGGYGRVRVRATGTCTACP